MTAPSAARIEALGSRQVDAAVLMLARAFAANPLHTAAFGPSAFEKNEAFFRAGLAVMKGPKVIAVEGTRVLGLVHWVRSPQCQLPTIEKLQILPVMVGAFGLPSALRVGSWLSAWSKTRSRRAARASRADWCRTGRAGTRRRPAAHGALLRRHRSGR